MTAPTTTSPRRTPVGPKSPSGAPRTSARGPGSSSRPSGGLLKRTQQVPRVSGANDAQLYARVSLSAEPWSTT